MGNVPGSNRHRSSLRREARRGGSAAFSRLLFLVLVNRNGIQILCFENLTAIQAPDIIYAVTPVQELGSLVLTSLHSEVTPILD
jgi:hypothetical protein